MAPEAVQSSLKNCFTALTKEHEGYLTIKALSYLKSILKRFGDAVVWLEVPKTNFRLAKEKEKKQKEDKEVTKSQSILDSLEVRELIALDRLDLDSKLSSILGKDDDDEKGLPLKTVSTHTVPGKLVQGTDLGKLKTLGIELVSTKPRGH